MVDLKLQLAEARAVLQAAYYLVVTTAVTTVLLGTSTARLYSVRVFRIAQLLLTLLLPNYSLAILRLTN